MPWRLIYASTVASTSFVFPGLYLFAIPPHPPKSIRLASFYSSALGTRYFKSDPEHSSLASSLLPAFYSVKLANGGSVVDVYRFKNNRYTQDLPTVFNNGRRWPEATFRSLGSYLEVTRASEEGPWL